MRFEINPLCHCKLCTGEGLGWIPHITKEQSKKWLDGRVNERDRYIQNHNNSLGVGWTGE